MWHLGSQTSTSAASVNFSRPYPDAESTPVNRHKIKDRRTGYAMNNIGKASTGNPRAGLIRDAPGYNVLSIPTVRGFQALVSHCIRLLLWQIKYIKEIACSLTILESSGDLFECYMAGVILK